MRIQVDVELDLPTGWEFEGLDFDPEEPLPWSSTCAWMRDTGRTNPGYRGKRTLMEVEARGLTPNEALAQIRVEIDKVVGQLLIDALAAQGTNEDAATTPP